MLQTMGFAPPVITCSPDLATAPDDDALWEQLAASQGFFIFARKPGASEGV
jgi:hypothetical protein